MSSIPNPPFKPDDPDFDDPYYCKSTIVFLRPEIPSPPYHMLLTDRTTGAMFTDTMAIGTGWLENWQLSFSMQFGGVDVHDNFVFGRGHLTANSREYVQFGHRPNQATIEIDLPFRLSGMDGTHTAENGLVVKLESIQHPLPVGAYNISFADIKGTVDNLSVEPDNWGLAGCTKVSVDVPGYLNEPDHEQIAALMKTVCAAINYILDLYSLYTNNYNVRRVAPSDFVRIELRQHLSGKTLRKFVWYFPSLVKILFAPPPPPDPDLKRRIQGFKASYSIAYRLLVSALRSLATDDPRSSVIEATQALEAALFLYIEAVLRADMTKSCTLIIPNKQPRIVNHLTFNKADPEITLNQALNELFVRLLPAGQAFDASTLVKCNEVRTARNAAIHHPSSFADSMIDRTRLDAVRSLIDFLAQHHP
jgi:hypothetical protein